MLKVTQSVHARSLCPRLFFIERLSVKVAVLLNSSQIFWLKFNSTQADSSQVESLMNLKEDFKISHIEAKSISLLHISAWQ